MSTFDIPAEPHRIAPTVVHGLGLLGALDRGSATPGDAGRGQ